jgi:autoinducer 2-degrading protein
MPLAPLIVASLRRLARRDLFPGIIDGAALSAAARSAPFALLAQTHAPDPLLAYANTTAAALFGLEPSDVGRMPTRLLGRDERARAPGAHAAPNFNFAEHMSGVRVTKDAQRAFRILDATAWAVTGAEGAGSALVGHAVMFSKWESVEPAPSAHVAIVDARVRPEHVALFRALTLENARCSAREPGVVRFDVVQRDDDPTLFVLVEAFVDAAAAAAHKATPHYLAWRDAVAPLMAEPRSARAGASVWPGPAAAFRDGGRGA